MPHLLPNFYQSSPIALLLHNWVESINLSFPQISKECMQWSAGGLGTYSEKAKQIVTYHLEDFLVALPKSQPLATKMQQKVIQF